MGQDNAGRPSRVELGKLEGPDDALAACSRSCPPRVTQKGDHSMKSCFLALCTMILGVTTAVAAGPSHSTEGRRMAKDILLPLGRAAVGAVIEGPVGRIVTGSPTGVVL